MLLDNYIIEYIVACNNKAKDLIQLYEDIKRYFP